MLRYKLIIFDWDGTVVNSTARIIDSMQQAATAVGMPVLPNLAIQNIIGLGLPEAIRTLWPSVNESQVAAIAPQYAHFFTTESKVEMELFDGVRLLLKDLLQRGHVLAVATGKTRKGLDRMMRELKLGHLFAITRCADETRSKPHPQMLHEILSGMGVAAHEALMVGDTTFDLDMAAAAGMPSIAMSYGAHDITKLTASNPLAVCHNINELRDWIFTHG